MNLLGRGYLTRYRYNCINSWNTWNSLKPVIGANSCEQPFVCLNKLTRCLKHNRFGSPCFQMKNALFSLTQVRFKEDCPPKFHRDMQFPDFAGYRKEEYTDTSKTSWGSGDDKPGFTYVLGFFGLLGTAYGTKSVLIHYMSFMGAAADILAMATIEVDISKIEPGVCLSYKWRGKPLFIKHRTSADIESEEKTPMSVLRDPETPEQRTSKPEWLVVIGICTHLGCVPIPNSGDWPGGFYCPCHGSHYDNVGRTRKGPAPLNLEVPPHKFVTDSLILIG